MTLDLALPHEDDTAALGRALGAALPAGGTVLLSGGLGAGKTALARAAIRALADAPVEVPSPTYTLVQIYEAADGGEIWHADLYRLADPSELIELGLDAALGTARCLVEWPERLERAPADALRVALTPAGDGRRARLDGPRALLDVVRGAVA